MTILIFRNMITWLQFVATLLLTATRVSQSCIYFERRIQSTHALVFRVRRRRLRGEFSFFCRSISRLSFSFRRASIRLMLLFTVRLTTYSVSCATAAIFCHFVILSSTSADRCSSSAEYAEFLLSNLCAMKKKGSMSGGCLPRLFLLFRSSFFLSLSSASAL